MKSAPVPPTTADAVDDVVAWLRQALDDDDIKDTDNFLAVGGHSMMAIELNAWLAERHDSTIDLAELFRASIRLAVESAVVGRTQPVA